MKQSKFSKPIPISTTVTTPITGFNTPIQSMTVIDDFGTFPMQYYQPNYRAYGCVEIKKEEGNIPMYINDSKPIDVQQKTYLNERARNVYYKLTDKLSDQFFLNDGEAPKTLAELKDRLASGKFMIQNIDSENIASTDWDDEEDQTFYNSILNAIRWRDPAKKADHAGRYIASAELDKKLTETKDQIMIGTPADGLKALQDLEAWVPSNLPS